MDVFGPKLSDIDKYLIILILLELGKIEKTKLILAEGAGLELFLDQGLDIFYKAQNLEFLLLLDFEDLSSVLKYSYILENFQINRI